MQIYSFALLAGGLFLLALGTLVFWNNKNSRLNQIFFAFTTSVSIWLLGSSFLFVAQSSEERIFWDRITYLGVVFIPATLYHFVLVFTQRKNQRNLLVGGYLLSLVFLVLSRTEYFVGDLYTYAWGFHTQARIFHHFFVAFFASYVLLFLVNLYQYRKEARGLQKAQVNSLLLLQWAFLWGSTAFLPAYRIDLFLFPHLAGIVGSGILAYAIWRYQLINMRLVLTQLLVGLIAVLLFVNFFVAQNTFEYLWKGALLAIFFVSAVLLIRSVLLEIKQKEQLQEAYKKLEELDRSKSEFVSIASHQLRTPLTAMKGYISMILEGSYGKLDTKQKKPIESVYESSERLIRLVNDLLNVSRIESGKIEMKLEQGSVEEIMKSVAEELGIKTKEKNVKLVLEKAEIPAPLIRIDKEKIRNALLNIVDNAIRYTNHGKIALSVLTQPKSLLIKIQDTGEGMTQEEIGKLFESFSRGGAGMKFSTEGAGLGLYIAKKFVEMHKGRIWAESQGKGQGSTFFVELPVV